MGSKFEKINTTKRFKNQSFEDEYVAKLSKLNKSKIQIQISS